MMKGDILKEFAAQRAFLRGVRAVAALYGFADRLADGAGRGVGIHFAAGVPFLVRSGEGPGGLVGEVCLGSPADGFMAVVEGGAVTLGGKAYAEAEASDARQVAEALLQAAPPGPFAIAALFAHVVPRMVAAMARDESPCFEDADAVALFVATGGAVTVGSLPLDSCDEDDDGFSADDILPTAPSAFPGKSRVRIFDPLERSPVRKRAIDGDEPEDDFFREGDDGYRTLLPFSQPRAEEVLALRDAAPHLSPLWDEVAAMARAAAVARVPLRLDPIVIVGPQGIGKTWAINRMRAALGLEGEILSMAGTSLNEVVQGGHPSWKGAAPGLVAKVFAKGDTANPLVCIDEFDKISAHQWRADPYAPYYALLEPEGGTTFVDEFLSIHFDTQFVSWLFTANDARIIPPLILDRVKVIEVSRPDRDQMRRMAASMVAEAHGRYGAWFAEFSPPDDLLDALSALSPRRSRLSYSSAMAKAVAGGRRQVSRSDLPVEGRERRAGFLG